MNVLIDRNFHFGPRTNFKDNYTWTKYILGKIKNKKSKLDYKKTSYREII